MAFLNRGKINSKELKFPIYLNALTKNLSKNLFQKNLNRCKICTTITRMRKRRYIVKSQFTIVDSIRHRD